MTTVNLRSLVDHLSDTCRQALEAAAGLCLARTHYNVEVEHWLLKLLELQGADLHLVLRNSEIDRTRLVEDVTEATERFKTGNSRAPALAPAVVDLAREAWLVASLDYGSDRAHSGHVLLALLSSDALARLAREASSQFEKLSAEQVKRELGRVASESVELKAGGGAPEQDSVSARAPASGAKGSQLEQYTIDLTAHARTQALDPVIGRDGEIRQMIDILTRRRQNNPILTGEAGVGKTAVVEGLAQRIAANEVPPALQGVTVRALDLTLLQAGASMKGEFEDRLKNVVEEVKRSVAPIILFIDEAHTMIGAGGPAGQGDAANILKPALARGELRTIAATTWAEYKKYFERDAALARRFQVVKIEEPDEATAVAILRGLVPVMEGHHKVRVLEEALEDAVRLSSRYLSGRQLPDKAVSVLDTACARVALSQASTPAAIEDCQRRLSQLGAEEKILLRESAELEIPLARLDEIRKESEEVESEQRDLEERWHAEQALVRQIIDTRTQLDPAHAEESLGTGTSTGRGSEAGQEVGELQAGSAGLRDHLGASSRQLEELQGDSPLVHPDVGAQAVAEVISNWTGIPVGRMVSDQIHAVLTLEKLIAQRIVGQDQALSALAQSIRTSRASLTDPRRPIGVFLLVGPSGVGKTETAIALAEVLYGGEQNMTVINMSEFKEEHKVSLLMGSPPGYVGYGEGGILTEAVRRKPYSVVLLDELEKAHAGVQDVFYQVFDKGRLRDGEGRDIDFRNTVILATTNAASEAVLSLCKDPETCPEADGLAEAIRPELLETFKPAFLGRVTVVPYYPLDDGVMRGIVELKLDRISARVKESYGAGFEWEPDVVDHVVNRCQEVESGARNVDHILNRTLLPELAAELLACMAGGRAVSSVRVAVAGDGGFEYALDRTPASRLGGGLKGLPPLQRCQQ